MKKLDPVKVYWIDSMGNSGWGSLREHSNMNCTTVGHFIEKTKDRLILAMNSSEYFTGDHMEIPLVAIKKIKKLKE